MIVDTAINCQSRFLILFLLIGIELICRSTWRSRVRGTGRGLRLLALKCVPAIPIKSAMSIKWAILPYF
jgi:hypothetical protein